MLSIAYLFYWTVTCIKSRLQNKYCQTAEDDKDQIADAEKVLSFDPPVYCQRYATVQQVILDDRWRGNIRKVVDFGCAELSFFMYLKHLCGLHEVLCVDVDAEVMEYNKNRVTPFTVDFLCKRKEPLHVEVLCGSIASPDPRLLNVDAVICIEIVEHLFPDTLDALPYNIFHFIEPRIAVFTTPNADFNVLFPNFSGIRHYDHKFEWSRQQFQDWAHNLVVRYPKYSVYFQGIGAGPKGTEHLGACSQMAVFIKESTAVQENSIKTLLLNGNNSDNCLFCSLNFDVTDIISNGVCTYETCSRELKNAHCAHNILYQEIRIEDYPYSVDNRTKDEIILEETEYRIHRLTVLSTRFSNLENDRAEIPLDELNSNRSGEFITTSDLRKILEAAGWTIENCDIDGVPTVCVIYVNKQSSSSSSSSSSLQSSQSNHSQTNFYAEPEDLWGHPGSDLEQNDPPNMWDEVSDKSRESKAEVASNSKSDNPVELIFDSGYQVSTSSIDLCSDLSKDWVSEERESADSLRTTQSEKQYRQFDKLNYSKSSDGNIFNVRRRKCKQQVVAPVQIEEEQEEIVENGDLANNNRDLEGNNYQPAANVEIDDNAVPRVEDLDEHNQNHELVDVEDVEDLEELDSLDDASREALFDPASEISFPDEQLFVQGEQAIYEPEEERFDYEFPEWMINLLDEANAGADDDDDDEPAHFYSGGDGVGIHPSGTDVADDSTSSSSEEAVASAANVEVNGGNVTGNVSEVSLADSGIVVAHSSQQQNGAHE